MIVLLAFTLGLALGVGAGVFLLAFAQSMSAEQSPRRFEAARNGLARAAGRGSW